MYTEKSGLNNGELKWTWFKNIVHEGETHWLSSKEKVLGVTVSKEGHADTHLRHEGHSIIDFLEKVATANSASNCQLP